MRIYLPDYNNCSVNVINSIAKHFGVTTTHRTLPAVNEYLKKDYKNVVFILLDGLGQSILLNTLNPNSFLRSHFVQELSAVYPSCTAPAIVSIKTGLTPVEHAWWGHNLYFKNLGQTINVFKNTDTFSKKEVSKTSITYNLLPYANILETINDKNNDVHTYTLCPTEARDNYGVSQVTYNTIEEMSEYLKTLTSLDGKHFIYVYHDNPDSTMHKYGTHSYEANKIINDLDCQLADLCENCPDTLFLITADHGQLNVKETRDITNYPDFVATLNRMPTGGTRCASFSVKLGQENNFLRLAKKYFGDKFAIVSKNEIIKNKLFGDGEPHPDFDDLIGDYVLCAISDCNLNYSTFYGRPFASPIGTHGGLTIDEMRVPLIIFGNK